MPFCASHAPRNRLCTYLFFFIEQKPVMGETKAVIRLTATVLHGAACCGLKPFLCHYLYGLTLTVRDLLDVGRDLANQDETRTKPLRSLFVRKTLTGQLENGLSYIPSLCAGAPGPFPST
jgi:hypothetical protein